MLYRLFGYFVRREACRLAAQAMRASDTEAGYTPRIWSLAVFFEMYMLEGSAGTAADFGPPQPVELNAIEAS